MDVEIVVPTQRLCYNLSLSFFFPSSYKNYIEVFILQRWFTQYIHSMKDDRKNKEILHTIIFLIPI